MIELYHFPWSPFCLVPQRILEFSGARFRSVRIPPNDRTLIWKITRQRYYQVPVIKDGRSVVFETDEQSQVIAKYLDNQLQLGLFPREWAGLQNILWRHIENEIEGLTFKLNDARFTEFVPKREQLAYIRHKERRFGRHCLDQWRAQEAQLLEQLSTHLLPFEQMLSARPYLLASRPLFVDFDLWGMLANFLYSGHYELPAAHTHLRAWYQTMSSLTLSAVAK